MRAIRTSLVLALAIAVLQACAHAPMPVPAVAAAKSAIQAAAADPDRAKARRLVRSTWGTCGNEILTLAIEPTNRPRVYRYTCSYQSYPLNQTCITEVKGEVDVSTQDVGIDEEVVKDCW